MNPEDPSNIWDAKAGSVGLNTWQVEAKAWSTEVLSPGDVARLIAKNPAKRFVCLQRNRYWL